METEIIGTALASAGAGATASGWFVKLLLESWLKRQDAWQVTVTSAVDRISTELSGIKTDLARMQLNVENFLRTEELARSLDRALAKIEHKIETVEKEIENLRHSKGHH